MPPGCCSEYSIPTNILEYSIPTNTQIYQGDSEGGGGVGIILKEGQAEWCVRFKEIKNSQESNTAFDRDAEELLLNFRLSEKESNFTYFPSNISKVCVAHISDLSAEEVIVSDYYCRLDDNINPAARHIGYSPEESSSREAGNTGTFGPYYFQIPLLFLAVLFIFSRSSLKHFLITVIVLLVTVTVHKYFQNTFGKCNYEIVHTIPIIVIRVENLPVERKEETLDCSKQESKKESHLKFPSPPLISEPDTCSLITLYRFNKNRESFLKKDDLGSKLDITSTVVFTFACQNHPDRPRPLFPLKLVYLLGRKYKENNQRSAAESKLEFLNTVKHPRRSSYTDVNNFEVGLYRLNLPKGALRCLDNIEFILSKHH